MDEKVNNALKEIKEQITKIDKKANNIYFFVYDSKGTPSGELEYIYSLAYLLKKNNYNVAMLYQLEKDEKFVGVRDWMGDDYANLPHYDIAKEKTQLSVSDILFIPEIFANVMNQTKKIPCKRIAIMHNYDYFISQMPFASQWGDFGMMEAVCNSNVSSNQIKSVFPYVKTTIINPFVNKQFGATDTPKQLIVNIFAKNQEDISKIVKAFYWKYPAMKWVSFRDLRGFAQKDLAATLRDSAITVWIDDSTSFGYSALEAMKSGNIVIAKLPTNEIDWMDKKTEKDEATLKNCCVWFNDISEVHKQIATVVRGWVTDNVPSTLFEEAKTVTDFYTEAETEKEVLSYIEKVNESRKKEMEELIRNVELNEKNKNKEQVKTDK